MSIKNDLSRACWIALLGIAATVLCVFVVGVPIASELVSKNDESLVAGLMWGMLGGAILGGGIVGLLCGRTGLSKIRLVTWLAAPGTLISIPVLGSAILAHEGWRGLGYVIVLVATSSLAAKMGAAVARRKEPAVSH